MGLWTFPPLSSLSLPQSHPCPVHNTPLLAPTAKTFPPPLALSLSLSHRPNISLPHFDSLSFPRTRFSLFLFQIRPYGIVNDGNKFRYTHWQGEIRGGQAEGSQHLGRRNTVLSGDRLHVGGWEKDDSKAPSLAIPTAISRSPQVRFNLLIILVHSIRGKSGRIVGMHFHTNW